MVCTAQHSNQCSIICGSWVQIPYHFSTSFFPFFFPLFHYSTGRAAFRILLKGGCPHTGGGGGASAMCCTLQYTYIVKSQGGKHTARGGGKCPPAPPLPLNATLTGYVISSCVHDTCMCVYQEHFASNCSVVMKLFQFGKSLSDLVQPILPLVF